MDISCEEKEALYSKLNKFFERQEQTQRLKFDKEIFIALYKQFLEECPYIDWNAWRHIPKDVQRNFEDLPKFDKYRTDILNRLVVVKLNGGLGTTMGCDKAKSLITVKDGLTFLDIAVKQIRTFNEENSCDVPLYLMNSFYTHKDTVDELRRRSYTEVRTFEQSKCPRIDAQTLLPVDFDGSNDGWYPPGHSNIFKALQYSGDLDKLIEEGRDIMFVSNIDNTCATLNRKIAQMMADENVEYAMECTNKTENDIKGGTLIDINGQLMHLEMPQVPPDHLDEFCSTKVFTIFNTNNIWVNLRAVRNYLNTMKSEIIVNKKKTRGKDVIQLETSIGGCIRNFPKSFCVHVPRSRFLPVKRTEDLILAASPLFSLSNEFSLSFNSDKKIPALMMGKCFQNMKEAMSRMEEIPNMENLRSLTVEGDVRFMKNVIVIGDVKIINHTTRQYVVEEGTKLNNEQIVID